MRKFTSLLLLFFSLQVWGQNGQLDTAKWVKNYLEAFKHQQKGNFYEENKIYLNLLNNPPNLEYQAYVYKNLAILQENINPNQSKIYLLKTIETYEKLQKRVEIIKAKIDLAKTYAQLREFNQGQKLILAIQPVLNDKELTAKQQISIHRKLAEYYQIKNSYDSVNIHLDSLLEWAEKTNDSVNIALTHIKRGKNFYDQDLIEKAISFYEKAFLFEKALTPLLKTDLYLGIATCYYGSDDEKNLYYYTKLLEPQMANAQVFFQQIQTNNDLHKSNLKNIKNQLALQRSESEKDKIQYYTSFLIFILFMFFGFYYYRHKQKEKARFLAEKQAAQQRILAEKEREIQIQESVNAYFASELHDGPKSKIRLAMRQVNDAATQKLLKEVLDDITYISERTANKEHLPLPRQISSFLDRIPSEDMSSKFSTTPHFPWYSLSAKTNLYLFRITTEIVSNILRHSEALHMDIRLEVRNDQVVLEIADNGKGFDQKGLSEGQGIKNMRQRTEVLGGTFELNTLPNEGTTVRVAVPLQLQAD